MKKIVDCLQKREWIYLLITLVFAVGQVWLDLKLPDYMSEITVLVQTEGSAMSEVLTAGAYMLACALGSLVLTVCVGFFAARVSATVAMRLRGKVYDKTLSFSMADMNSFSTGSLITRSTNDITQVQNFIALGYIAAIRAPLLAVWAITKIWSKNASFTTITLIAVLCLICVSVLLITFAFPKFKVIQKLTDDLNTVVREHLTGVRVVRAYNAEEYQEEKFETTNEKVAKTHIFVNRLTAAFSPYMTFLMSALTLAIYWLGTFLINDALGAEKLTIFSDMVVFSSYAMLIVMAFMMLTFTFIMAPRVMVALGRIGEVIDYENNIVDGEIDTSNQVSPVSVEFKNVTFHYPGGEEPVLNNVSFKINKGETASFIGATGSGKSTIVNLILRFYDVTSGEILVDGINIKNYTVHALREKLGLVSQKAVLFSGDISSNIAYGVDENLEQINFAVGISQSKDFVEKVGVKGRVSQGGLNLSGGQKQRLSIARAIYKNPDIYIFDDCFSALDYRTDKTLRAQLLKETAGKTKLIVAQRISTVKDSDQIIVIDSGEVVGMGKHRELLENCRIYLEIAQSQLSKEELEYA